MGETWSHLSGVAMACLIATMLLTQARRVLALRRMRQGFPELARQLGLGFEPSRYSDGQGLLTGVYRGREVHVDPDDARALTVHFSRCPAIELRRRAAQPSSLGEPFATRDARFDAFWRVRRASAELGCELAERASAAWLEVFRGRYARNITGLDVTRDGVRCEVDFGAPPHLPLAAARELLAACVSLADHIEAVPAAQDAARPSPSVESLPCEPRCSLHVAALVSDTLALLAQRLWLVCGGAPEITPRGALPAAPPAESAAALHPRRVQRRGAPPSAAGRRGRRSERLRPLGPGRRARTDPALARRPLLGS